MQQAESIPWSYLGSVFVGDPAVRSSIERDEIAPAPELIEYVRAYWWFRWDVGNGELTQLVMPRGCAYLSFERTPAFGRLRNKIVFPRRHVSPARLTGRHDCIGVEFHPGAFFPFWGRDVAKLPGQVWPLGEAFADDAERVERSLHGATTFAEQAAIYERLLLARRPHSLPDEVTLVRTMVEAIRMDVTLVRVSDLVDRFAIGESRLLRLFSRWVGVSPKLLLRTRRFQSAIRSVVGGAAPSWGALAQDLGYSDQAHFNNEFRDVTGFCPSALAANAGFLQDRSPPAGPS